MSLLSWMLPSKKTATPPAPDSSGLSRVEPTRPVRGREMPESNAQPANRKGERMARRELLYGVVREAMMRAGVLTSNYKFKVLSLDGRGRQFLVMVDLARDSGMGGHQFAESEALIAQSAKARHGILVSAVYWRMNETVAVGDPQAVDPKAEAHREPAAEPETIIDPAPAPVGSKSATRSKYDAIRDDEMAAFKRAKASGVANAAAAAAAEVGVDAKHGPQNYTLLTGFEDTEMSEADGDGKELSGTQYGALY
jgi:hypothetical protein